MSLSKEKALELHRKMWSAMREKFGDCPSAIKRELFKEEWCDKHFPNKYILHCCFLCEYAMDGCKNGCNNCPIDWSSLSAYQLDTCYAKYKGVVDSVPDVAIFCAAPISKILALPERK